MPLRLSVGIGSLEMTREELTLLTGLKKTLKTNHERILEIFIDIEE